MQGNELSRSKVLLQQIPKTLSLDLIKRTVPTKYAHTVIHIPRTFNNVNVITIRYLSNFSELCVTK